MTRWVRRYGITRTGDGISRKKIHNYPRTKRYVGYGGHFDNEKPI